MSPTVKKALMPSLFSLMTSFILSALFLLFVLLPLLFDTLGYNSYFKYLKQNPTTRYEQLTSVSDIVNTNPLAADVAIFIFWALIGIVSYIIVSGLKRLVQSLNELRSEATEFRRSRRTIIVNYVVGMIVRISASVVLSLVVILVTSLLIPFIFKSSVRLDQSWFAYTLFSAGIVVTALITLHVITVALRIIRLRTRVF